MITESQNRVLNELNKTESNVEKSIKEENLANRERILNESLLKLEYDEQRVSQKQKQLKDAEQKYKEEEEQYLI